MGRYNLIRKMDISNGEGIRVSCFMQGCSFNCKGCFNQETHDFNGGKEFTQDTINEILSLADKSHIKGLSILGGEPLHPANIENTIILAKEFKEKYPDKNIWVWTGYKIENLNDKQKEVLEYIDVLVDGKYVEELNDPTLKFRGSSNQRVIDIPKTLENEQISYYYKEDRLKSYLDELKKYTLNIIQNEVHFKLGKESSLIQIEELIYDITDNFIDDLNKNNQKEEILKILVPDEKDYSSYYLEGAKDKDDILKMAISNYLNLNIDKDEIINKNVINQYAEEEE